MIDVVLGHKVKFGWLDLFERRQIPHNCRIHGEGDRRLSTKVLWTSPSNRFKTIAKEITKVQN
jgi:hypothetical protein